MKSKKARRESSGSYIVNAWDYLPTSAWEGNGKRRLVGIEELSLYLSMPIASIYTYVHTGKIPGRCIVRLSRKLRFDVVEIDKWIDGSRRGRAS